MELDAFQDEMKRLEEDESVAAGFFRALVRRAEGAGVGEEDYKAPIGFRLHRQNKPWIAEFGTTDKSDKLDLRLYWGEAPDDEQSLVACLIGAKRRFVVADLVAQDKHVGTAMDLLRRWCNTHRKTYRKQV